jgi:hypothetical protein
MPKLNQSSLLPAAVIGLVLMTSGSALATVINSLSRSQIHSRAGK